MNESRMTPVPLDDDVSLDRLVDGELSPDEYRRLLATLDDDPGGWRRCALAFLEAQALQRELVALRGEVISQRSTAKASPPRQVVSVWQALLTIAASIVLAFGVGAGLAEFFSPKPQEPLAGGNNRSQLDNLATIGQSDGNRPRQHDGLRPAGSVRLVVSNAGDEPTDVGELPVFEAGANMEQYLAERKPAIPVELVEWLESRGHTVERHEQYLPIDLEDGRHMIVPVEGYRITPAAIVF